MRYLLQFSFGGLFLVAGVLFCLQPAAGKPVPFKLNPHVLNVKSPDCSHVKILTPAQADQVEEQFRSKIISPGPNQKKALETALDALPPLVCQAVRRVVFLNAVLPAAGEAIAWVGKSRPDLINISAVPGSASEKRLDVDLSDLPTMDADKNEKRKQALVKVWPEVIHSIIHESYHCATNMLESVTEDHDGTSPDVWPAAAKASAKAVVAKIKIKNGFRKEWTRLSQAFENLGFAAAYDRSRTGRLNDPPAGFMTYYGGNSPGEDIAETASWVTARSVIDAAYKGVKPDVSDWKYGCSKLKAYRDKGIPGNLAALYTKLRFLEDAGLITSPDLQDCVGSVGLEPAGRGKGFQFYDYQTWKPLTTYDTDVRLTRRPGIFGLSGWGQLKAAGQLRRAVIELQFTIKETEFPRGIYEIKSCNSKNQIGAYPFASPVQFKRSVENMGNQTICAYQALVLVTTATTDRFRGSVVLQKVWKFSTPPVPEVSGFPVHVVFGYE